MIYAEIEHDNDQEYKELFKISFQKLLSHWTESVKVIINKLIHEAIKMPSEQLEKLNGADIDNSTENHALELYNKMSTCISQ